MGALPNRKVSRARGGSKEIAYKLKAIHPSICPQCRSAKLPHRACPSCGFYKGRQVISVGGDIDQT